MAILGFWWNDFSFLFFYLQVAPIFPTKFSVNWPFSSGEEGQIDFQIDHHCGNLGFPMETILVIFDLQVAPIPPSKFRVNWPFRLGEKAINMAAILDLRSERFYLFLICIWSARCPNSIYQVWSQMAFRFRRRSAKYIFKMAATEAILDFQSELF